MGEIKYVLIRLYYDPSIHHVIDIYVVDLLECYGMLLRRVFLVQLSGYFATNWSHMLVPKKDQNNYTRVERDIYMKHIVTYLEVVNEPPMFTKSVLGNHFLDSFFRDVKSERSPFMEASIQSKLFHYTLTKEEQDGSHFAAHIDLGLDSLNSNLEIEYYVHNTNKTYCFYLHFDGSKSREGAGAGCILQDPKGIRIIMAYRLEFECTNNTAEYEKLLHGLRKVVDLEFKHIKVLCDSKIVTCAE